jgi:phosphoribosyl 1,2-cyclic phosphate phosphodiesterase
MLGERVRIDFGPDSYHHSLVHGLHYERLEHLLVTHSHDDHWDPVELQYRRQGFSRVSRPLAVFGNDVVHRKFEAANGADWGCFHLEFNPIAPWRPFGISDGWTATPVPASHDPSELCVNYRLARDGFGLLIAHDTGWFEEAVWDRLPEKPLSVVLFDCTYGPEDRTGGHLGCEGVLRARDELDRRGALVPGARVFATHFSHNGGLLHEELVSYFRPHGIEPAFDGLRISLPG